MFYFSFINKNALHIAAERGNIDICNALLKRTDIDINMKTIEISTF